MITNVEFDVSGKSEKELADSAYEQIGKFVSDVTKWRIMMQVHFHAHESQWIGKVTARPKRKRDDDDFDW